ncbi:Rieske 2Fe-2S domain-containing protein [Yinghuangia soli]|uniref:MBL fold metallo-hydrolase n=1 Tax=Yinghuangia soli TaxID=2908204 RepID=A0AA41U323_9ACTN|nr:Rieske 2Fe-2S domain-containing protein [Yinghuangia soli]MCF2529262.1 MBL fold metallo-hydrolase [Yinghuangia soli]
MNEPRHTVHFYGHACIYVQTPDVSLVVDPWFTRRGAFLSTWHQFPRNDQLDLEPLRAADYVFLSHEHRDHFDPEFLRTLRPDTKILIPRYTDGYLQRELAGSVRNEVVVLDSHETYSLGPDLAVTPVVQSVPIWDDCTLVIRTPQATIADVNDMKLSARDLAWLRESFDIDYLFMQFSGANWHPYVYDYSPEEKRRISRHKRENKFGAVHKMFAASGARWLVPAAGPPCFLDPEFSALNLDDDSIFPTQAEFHAYAEREGFAERTVILLPGDELVPHVDHAKDNKRRLEHPCFTDRHAYLSDYQRDRAPDIAQALAEIPQAPGPLLGKLREYFQPLVSASAFFRDRIGGRLLVESVGACPESVIVDFTRYQDSVYPHAGEDYFYRLRVEDRLLNLVLDRELSWEELFLSLRFEASREPDRYNEFLVVFLRFADPESYRAYARYERGKQLDERTVVEHEGSRYEIQRYCPHAMADLATAEIKDGCVVCPGHGWAFRLDDGTCATNPARIAVRPLADPSPQAAGPDPR